VDDSHLPAGVRRGVGSAIAQKFAREGFFVVLTTRTQDKSCWTHELQLTPFVTKPSV
jgi:NAD(P)-dependent dehydrogenase (short-subunit alcohol dehydrogenase family)